MGIKKVVQAWNSVSLVKRIVIGLVIGGVLGVAVPNIEVVELLGTLHRPHLALEVDRGHPQHPSQRVPRTVFLDNQDQITEPGHSPAALLEDLPGDRLGQGLPRLESTARELVVARHRRVHHQQLVRSRDHRACRDAIHDPRVH